MDNKITVDTKDTMDNKITMDSKITMDTKDSKTPHYDITIDRSSPESLLKGCLSIVAKVRPEWKVAEINLEVFTDGLTNKLVGASLNKAEENGLTNGENGLTNGENGLTNGACREEKVDKVLVKVYGEDTDKYINRKMEIVNMKRMFSAGCGSQLYATFTNGISYEFLPGTTLKPDVIKQPHVYRKVARAMAAMHRVELPEEEKKSTFWQDLDKLIDLYPTNFKDPVKQEQFNRSLMTKEEMREEAKSLKTSLKDIQSPVVFCHNDPLINNMVHNGDTVTLIDFEYGGPNYSALDIANVFNFYVGAHGQLDYEKDYPGPHLIKDWLNEYLTHFNGHKPSEVSVDDLHKEVLQFSPCAHLFWSVWSIVQADISSIDFDFLDYAKQMMEQYKKQRADL